MPSFKRVVGIELLVLLPRLVGIAIQFIGLDGKARYKVYWSEDYQTTREIIQKFRPDLLSLYDESNPTGKWNSLNKNIENRDE